MTNKKELLKWEAEVKSVLNELNWKLIKTERALYLHLTGLEEVNQKLRIDLQRVEETKKALQFLSETHPLRYKCEEDLLKTEIRIFRLENRLKKMNPIKTIQLEIKKAVALAEIKYYESILEEIQDSANPPLVSNSLRNPDLETVSAQPEKNLAEEIYNFLSYAAICERDYATIIPADLFLPQKIETSGRQIKKEKQIHFLIYDS